MQIVVQAQSLIDDKGKYCRILVHKRLKGSWFMARWDLRWKMADRKYGQKYLAGGFAVRTKWLGLMPLKYICQHDSPWTEHDPKWRARPQSAIKLLDRGASTQPPSWNALKLHHARDLSVSIIRNPLLIRWIFISPTERRFSFERCGRLYEKSRWKHVDRRHTIPWGKSSTYFLTEYPEVGNARCPKSGRLELPRGVARVRSCRRRRKKWWPNLGYYRGTEFNLNANLTRTNPNLVRVMAHTQSRRSAIVFLSSVRTASLCVSEYTDSRLALLRQLLSRRRHV